MGFLLNSRAPLEYTGNMLKVVIFPVYSRGAKSRSKSTLTWEYAGKMTTFSAIGLQSCVAQIPLIDKAIWQETIKGGGEVGWGGEVYRGRDDLQRHLCATWRSFRAGTYQGKVTVSAFSLCVYVCVCVREREIERENVRVSISEVHTYTYTYTYTHTYPFACTSHLWAS